MKSSFGGPIIKLLIFAGILAVLINDGGSIMSSRYLLRERAETVADKSISIYKISNSKSQALTEAEIAAKEIDATLTEFNITKDRFVELSIEIPNHKTWVAHRIPALQPLLKVDTHFSKRIN
jgi:hypothetical protein